MAEGVLFDVAKGIIGIAGKLALQEVALIWGVKDEINKLKETVSKISAVILDAEAKQHGSEVIKKWLKELKDAMCDADDLLDEISTEAIGREVMTRDKKAKEMKKNQMKKQRNLLIVEVEEKELKAAGAEPLPDGCHGLRIHGWEIETRKLSILTSSNLQLSVGRKASDFSLARDGFREGLFDS